MATTLDYTSLTFTNNISSTSVFTNDTSTSIPYSTETFLNSTVKYDLGDSSAYEDYGDLDYTQHDYPGEGFKDVPAWEIALKTVTYIPVIVHAIVGNILIILVVARNKRMQTTTNYYIVNLAVADLLVAVSCSWVHLVDDLTNGWVLGAFFCRFNTFAQGTLTTIANCLYNITIYHIKQV